MADRRRAAQRSWASVITLACVGCSGAQKAEPARCPHLRVGGFATTWRFDDVPAGRVPAGWKIQETNPTESVAKWSVLEDPTAPSGAHVMALTESSNYNGTYNLALAKRSSATDLDLTVRVKAVAGEEDQGGGPVWRCADNNNYYICRINPLESNYRVYVVKDGRRKQLQSATVDLEAGRWYTIRVTMAGDQIACYLDGEKMLQAVDNTFTRAGMVGLWTKADAVTSFDDLMFTRGSAGEPSSGSAE